MFKHYFDNRYFLAEQIIGLKEFGSTQDIPDCYVIVEAQQQLLNVITREVRIVKKPIIKGTFIDINII